MFYLKEVVCNRATFFKTVEKVFSTVLFLWMNLFLYVKERNMRDFLWKVILKTKGEVCISFGKKVNSTKSFVLYDRNHTKVD